LNRSPSALPNWNESVRFADDLFRRLRCATASDRGILRPSYGTGEQRAHDLVREAGETLKMTPTVDAAGNLHLTSAGASPNAPRWLTGSHLDAVPDGGNYDGAAGVIAGLAVVHALRAAGITPPRDITVIGFRAEEGSSWFDGRHKSHFGSRGLLGQLRVEEMNVARSLADGSTLYDCIQRSGFRPEQLGLGRPCIDIASVYGFAELHIEQGPLLVSTGFPVGIVEGIRGTTRARNARCTGQYAHSGAVPQDDRKDAVFGAAEFAVCVEEAVERWAREGRDVVCAMGRFHTDVQRHSLTKVSGEVQFTIDLRSLDEGLLHKSKQFLIDNALRIGSRRGVNIDVGSVDIAAPARMSRPLQAELARCAASLNLSARVLASGAGHDAANFSAAGIPTAMIFVRNEHGSHNHLEAMDIKDFSQGARLLAELLLQPNPLHSVH
jgi:N-carbamoyl-L-amino-acid hydrolase